MLLACLLAATLAAPSGAAPAQKPRTLSDLIALAMKEGKEDPLNADMATELGLTEREIPGRTLRYKQSISPDRVDHSFQVLYEVGGKDGSVPTAVVITVTKGTKDDGKWHVDGNVYLGSLKGKLRTATHNVGIVGDVRATKVEITDAVRKRFKSELDYFRKVVPSLGLDFVR